MYLTHAINRYRRTSYLFFKWRDALCLPHRLALTFAFACLTGLAAQIRIPLPFTPVPVTGQVLAVLLSGILLGGYYGGLSQLLYLGLGVMGVPWFSYGGGITGVTGGYIIGFVPAALLIGWLTHKYSSARRFHFQLLLMASGVCIVYIFGAAQFAFVTKAGLLTTAKLSILPFIPVDLMKAALAATVSASILSGQSGYSPNSTQRLR